MVCAWRRGGVYVIEYVQIGTNAPTVTPTEAPTFSLTRSPTVLPVEPPTPTGCSGWLSGCVWADADTCPDSCAPTATPHHFVGRSASRSNVHPFSERQVVRLAIVHTATASERRLRVISLSPSAPMIEYSAYRFQTRVHGSEICSHKNRLLVWKQVSYPSRTRRCDGNCGGS